MFGGLSEISVACGKPIQWALNGKKCPNMEYRRISEAVMQSIKLNQYVMSPRSLGVCLSVEQERRQGWDEDIKRCPVVKPTTILV